MHRRASRRALHSDKLHIRVCARDDPGLRDGRRMAAVASGMEMGQVVWVWVWEGRGLG